MSALRILHVDDEPDIRELVEISLGLDPELNVKCCSSGADALVAATDWSPDLILIDVMMPVMDGPQTLGHLRQDETTAKIPVVFMTARAQARELAHFLTLGAAGIIPKPFDPMVLAGTVKQYLHAATADPAQSNRRFIAQIAADAKKIAELRLMIAGDPEATYSRIGKIAHSLAAACISHEFMAVGSASRVLERMAEDAHNGIGNAHDVERAIEQLTLAIDRDCGEDRNEHGHVRSSAPLNARTA